LKFGPLGSKKSRVDNCGSWDAGREVFRSRVFGNWVLLFLSLVTDAAPRLTNADMARKMGLIAIEAGKDSYASR
jgi:hypothetical protein